jgi:hypothetical protein
MQEKIDRIDKLYRKALLIVSREVRNLHNLSVRGKLTSPHARDLVSYVKVLEDIKKADKAAKAAAAAKAEEAAKALSDEELQRLAGV